MTTLHLFGIDHARAPLAARSELAFSSAGIVPFLPRLLALPAVVEAFLVSTRDRTEIYLAVEGEPPHCPLKTLGEWRPRTRLPHDACSRYHLRDAAAAEHLFRSQDSSQIST